MRVLILTTQDGDWEGLYINGSLYDEGDVLGEGDNRLYMLKMAEEHEFNSSDVEVKELSDEDNAIVNGKGSCLYSLGDYNTEY